jgi:hypothetical protein
MPELEEALSALWCIGYRSTFRMRRLLGDCSFQSGGLLFLPDTRFFGEKGGSLMGKKLLTLLFVSALPLSTVFAQEAPAKEKAAKEVHWEGTVVRSNADKSTLTVRRAGTTNAEMTIQYDSSTKWVSQFHGDKKVNDIDSSQVTDGDVVICKGTSDKAGVLHATLISKRLSHSPAK